MSKRTRIPRKLKKHIISNIDREAYRTYMENSRIIYKRNIILDMRTFGEFTYIDKGYGIFITI